MTGGEETGPSTRSVHGGQERPGPGGPVVFPVYQSATFFTDAVPEGEVRYTRYGNNPNHQALAAKIAALEGAEAAIVLASGNAAAALSLLTCLAAGDHVVAARALYGGTLRLLSRELPRLGIRCTHVDGMSPQAWSAAVEPETRAFFVEIPVNPTLRVPDLRGIVAVARERNVPVIVDATFATPINFRPLHHGADLVMHSGTKYLGGHSDVTAGVLAGRADLIAEVREKLISFGPVLDPHATWLLDRGVKSLAARMTRHNENGLTVARWLCTHPHIEHVLYPGLETHPDHAIAKDLFSGFGGVVSAMIRGGDDAALRVMQRLRLISAAPSLGGVESLASMPRFTSHASLTPEARRSLGIGDGFVRLALGIEDARDLIADLEQALAPEGD